MVVVVGDHIHRAGGFDVDAGAHFGLGDNLGDDDVNGAAHGHRTCAGNADRVGGDELAGVGIDVDAAADSAAVLIGNTGVVVYDGLRLTLEVSDNGHAGDTDAAGRADGQGGVYKRIVAVCRREDVPLRLHGSAENGVGLALEDQGVDAAGHTGRAAHTAGERQKPYIVIGIGLNRHILAGGDGAAGLCRYILSKHHGHHRGADAGAAAHADAARAVIETGHVLGVHDHVCQSGLRILGVIARGHIGILRIGEDAVVRHQRGDGCAYTRLAGPCGGNSCHDDPLFRRRTDIDAGNIGSAVQAVQRLLRLGLQYGVAVEGRMHRIVDDGCRNGSSHGGAAAAEGQTAGRVNQQVLVVALEGHAAAGSAIQGASVGILNAAVGHKDRDAADDGRGTGRGPDRRCDQNGGVLAQRAGGQVLTGVERDVVSGVHNGAALGHVHVHGGADGRPAEGDAGGKDGVGKEHIGLCQQNEVALLRFESGAVADVNLRLRLGHLHADCAAHGRAGGGSGDCRHDGDEVLLILGRHAEVAAAGREGHILADDGIGDSLVEVYVHGAAGRCAACGHSTHGLDQQEVCVGLGADINGTGRIDHRAVRQRGDSLAPADDDVDPAACGGAAGRDGSRYAEDLGIGLFLRRLVIAAGVDADLAHIVVNLILVDQQADVGAHGGAAGRAADRARDDTGVGAGLRVDADGAVLILSRALFGVRGHVDDGIVADGGVDGVVEVDHGEGARHGGRAAAAGADRPADSLGVVVGTGEEVQQVDRLQEVFAGDVDADLVAVAVRIFLHVDRAGLSVAVSAGGVGHRIRDAVGQLIILDGDHALLGKKGQAAAGDACAVADGGLYVVVADDHGHACAHADRSALGDADAARADGHFALVNGVDRDLMRGNLHAVADGGLGGGAADQDGDRPADSRAAVAASHRARDGLRAEETVVLAGGILAEVGVHRHVAVLAFKHGAVPDRDVRLVAVDADSDARRDGIAAVGTGHGDACTEGAEVGFVARENVDAAGRVDAAGNGGADLVLGDGETYGGRHLDARALAAGVALDVDILIAGAVGLGLGLGQVGIGLGRVGLVADILAAHDVGGQRLLRSGLVSGGAVALLVAVVVKLLVDVVSGLVVLILVPVGAFGNGSGSRENLRRLLALVELVDVALHIRAHGGGNGVGLVLVQAGARDVGRAVFQRRRAVKAHVDAGVNDVDGHGRADGGGAAHREAAGAGDGVADFIRGQDEVGLRAFVLLLAFIVLSCLRGIIGRRLFSGFLGFLGFFGFLDIDDILAVGGDGRAAANPGRDRAVQEVQRDGGVNGDLAGVAFAAAAAAAAAAVVVVAAIQRIRAGGGRGLHLAVGFGANGQRVGVQHAVIADGRLGVHLAIGEGEGGAHAHGAALTVGGSGLRAARRVRVFVCRFEGDSVLRHEEDEGGLILSAVLFDDNSDSVFLAVVLGVGVVQLVKLLAVGILHRHGDQIAVGRLALRLIVVAGFDLHADVLVIFRYVIEHRAEDDVVGDVGLLVLIVFCGKLKFAVGDLHLAGLLLPVLVGIGVGHLIGQGIAVLNRELNLVAVAALRNLAFADGLDIMDADRQGEVAALGSGVGRLGLPGALVGIRIAVFIHGAGRRGGDLLVIRGQDIHFPAGLNRRPVGSAGVRDLRLCGAVDHGDRHGTGHAHAAGARAADGLGGDEVLLVVVVCLGLDGQIHQPVEGVKRAGGKTQTGVLHAVDQGVLQVAAQGAALDIGREVINVDDSAGNGIDGLILDLGSGFFDRLLHGLLEFAAVKVGEMIVRFLDLVQGGLDQIHLPVEGVNSVLNDAEIALLRAVDSVIEAADGVVEITPSGRDQGIKARLNLLGQLLLNVCPDMIKHVGKLLTERLAVLIQRIGEFRKVVRNLLGIGDDSLNPCLELFGQTLNGLELAIELLQLIVDCIDLFLGKVLRLGIDGVNLVHHRLGVVVDALDFRNGVRRGRLRRGLDGLDQRLLHAFLQLIRVEAGVQDALLHTVKDDFRHVGLQVLDRILAQLCRHAGEIRIDDGFDRVGEALLEQLQIDLELLQLIQLIGELGDVGQAGGIQQLGEVDKLIDLILHFIQIRKLFQLVDRVDQALDRLISVCVLALFLKLAKINADVNILDGFQRVLESLNGVLNLIDRIVKRALRVLDRLKGRVDDLHGAVLDPIGGEELSHQAAVFQGLDKVKRLLAHCGLKDLVDVVLYEFGNIIEDVLRGLNILLKNARQVTKTLQIPDLIADAGVLALHFSYEIAGNLTDHAGNTA